MCRMEPPEAAGRCRCMTPWLSEKCSRVGGRERSMSSPVGEIACGGRRPGPDQAVWAAIRWWWSLRRLWVALISRHSERTADLPRRWKR
jgi:hypothetical protein